MYAKLDDVFALLAEELELNVRPLAPYVPDYGDAQIAEDVFVFPGYLENGFRADENEDATVRSRCLRLDLREGQRVVLTSGPYKGDAGEVVGKKSEGHYVIRFKHAIRKRSKLKVPFERVLGLWWMDGASKRIVHALPVVNEGNKDDKTVSARTNTTTVNEAISSFVPTGSFSVEPIDRCPHIGTVADVAKLRDAALSNRCEVCKDERENWLCLTTATCLCSRYVKGHMQNHFKSGHCVALSLQDLSFWCNKCENYLNPFTIEALKKPFDAIHRTKFGVPPALPRGITISLAANVRTRGQDEDDDDDDGASTKTQVSRRTDGSTE